MRQRNPPKPSGHQVLAVIIGNAIEWYDFIIFGILAGVIAKVFFPPDAAQSGLLLAFATFGAGFVMRPIGGLLLGIYADQMGRRAALTLILLLMTLATTIITLLPGYASIGLAAPIILALARLLQGFATGGEFAAATTFLLESAPPGRRGFYAAWQMVGQSVAIFFGVGITYLLTRRMDTATFEDWGWRIPFVFGLLILPVSLWLRRHLRETRAFVAARAEGHQRPTFAELLWSNVRAILVVTGLAVCGTVCFYVLLVYMPTYAHVVLGLTLADAFQAQMIAIAAMTVLIPWTGHLSDRLGRKPLLQASTLLLLILLWPLFARLADTPTFANLLLTQVVLCTSLALFLGPVAATIAEQLPVSIRSTGLTIGYNLAVMVFGGFAQFIVTWLIQTTGQAIAPVYYVLFAVALGLLASSHVQPHDTLPEEIGHP